MASTPGRPAMALELAALKERLETLEKQNQALLQINQVEVTTRSHTPTLEPVKEEEAESDNSLIKKDCDHEIDKPAAGCIPKLEEVMSGAKRHANHLRKVAKGVLHKATSGLKDASPKHIYREYKLKQLRKQWREEIRQSWHEQQRQSRAVDTESSSCAQTGEEKSEHVTSIATPIIQINDCPADNVADKLTEAKAEA
jgi:hypothetical protein